MIKIKKSERRLIYSFMTIVFTLILNYLGKVRVSVILLIISIILAYLSGKASKEERKLLEN